MRRTRKQSRRARAGVVALASLVGLVLVGAELPTSAGAAWTAPATLSAAAQNALDPQVAVDASGNAVFTWRRSDGTNWRIQARARSAAGALGPVQTLSAAGQNALTPQVAVDANGNAVFTWRRFDGTHWRIQSRARSAAGALGPIQTLSAAGRNATLPQLGVDSAGDAVFVWQRSDGTNWRVQSRARSAAGALATVQTLSAAGQNSVTPQVAVDPAGRAVFTWERYGLIQARARTAAGALSPVQTLSPPLGGPYYKSANSPQVGVDAHGNAVFAWSFYDQGYGPPRGASRVQARARSVAGALSPIQYIMSPGAGGGGCGCDPQVAVDPAGNAVFSWALLSDYLGQFRWVEVRARSAAGALSPIQSLTPKAGQEAGIDPQIGVDAAGNAVVTWHFESGISAQVRSAGGALGPLQTFPVSGVNPLPQVGVNGAGAAVVTWQNSNGTNTVIQGAAGP
jgi:hypothetical protein